jgi:hypothetical protein
MREHLGIDPFMQGHNLDLARILRAGSSTPPIRFCASSISLIAPSKWRRQSKRVTRAGRPPCDRLGKMGSAGAAA